MITAADRLRMQAKGDITLENTVNHLTNQDVLNRTAGIAVTGNQGVTVISAGRNLNLAGAVLQALGEKGAVILQAGQDVNVSTQTLHARKDMTLNQDNYLRTQRQTEIGTTIDAKSGVAVQSGQDIHARAAYINSDDGTVTMAAGRDIHLTTGREMAVDDYALKHKEKGLLSSTTTTVRTHDDHENVLGTTVTGKNVRLGAGQDVQLTAATIAAQGDVAVAAGRHLTADTAVQYDQSTAYTKVKSSGVLGAGLGLMIGTQQTKDNYQGEWKTQVGTNVASTGGSVTMAAGDTMHLTAADVFAPQGVTLTGQDVILDGTVNEAHEKQTHEESRSGLSLSLSNPAISAGETFRGAVRTAQSRDNKTLRGLEIIDAGRDLRKDLKGKSPADVTSVGLHVGIGSSSFKQESEVNRQTYAGGSLTSAGSIAVRAESAQENKGNLTAVGETIQGKDVSLTAGRDLTIQAGTNTERSRDSYQSHGTSIGASFHGGLTGIDASYGKAKDQGTMTGVSHTGSQIMAQNHVETSSGKDTNLIGSRIQGQSVTVNVGQNLHIESLQDTEIYRGSNSSTGLSTQGISKLVGNASYNKGKMTSDYASVTEQAGVYAGEKGFDVKVGGDTQLKGAVIASTADANQNHLTTGTLQMEDIQNKAAYDAKGSGFNFSSEYISKDNPLGLEYGTKIPIHGYADSTTYAAVTAGIIKITKEKSFTAINHDTTNALNKLSHIFSKKDVEERQELITNLSQEGNDLIGELSLSEQRRLLAKGLQAKREGKDALFRHYFQEAEKWQDGGAYKIALHSALGAVVSSFSGEKISHGIVASSINERLQPILSKIDNSEIHKLASALIGKVTTHSSTGAAIALHETQFNFIPHEDQQYFLQDIEKFYTDVITREEFIQKLKYYTALDIYYTNIANSDNISNNLKIGGDVFVAMGLSRDSLMDIFMGEGIDTLHGFSTALAEFDKMYGVEYAYNDEIAEIIHNVIEPARGKQMAIAPEDDIGGKVQAGLQQPYVVAEGYQASDGQIYHVYSDNHVELVPGDYMGIRKLQEGFEPQLGSDGAWYADGFWVPAQDVRVSKNVFFKNAIRAGFIPDPNKMKSDYQFFEIGGGIAKFLGVSGGFILDKQGNLYGFKQFNAGAGIAPPVYINVGKGYIETNWKGQNENFIEAITGESYGISGSSIISASVSKGTNEGAITIEVAVSTSAGTNISKRIAYYLGNIYHN
ncbi:hemagglutinin repeat-containing protein [Mitsuokella sp.]|uniref:hemagglutinin repeat-containing protein n=1 Tax=Mitsuokella sp. TaxID=2049034 RepID=UPI002A82491E|nr:hemagglutinin repeat-containing protein [Mitsuokella sp.]MDY4475580.1 hemagglutinin repeat-containing protein [Mitsuokella sp.]